MKKDNLKAESNNLNIRFEIMAFNGGCSLHFLHSFIQFHIWHWHPADPTLEQMCPNDEAVLSNKAN